MTLVISKGLTLRKGWQPMDPDAAAYIAAVETADGQALEEKTKIAIDNFVLGCKADGIWNAIKASCILAGARTLTGALVPLVGTAPANVGGLFVSGDYNRKTGLLGDGSTKYLNSNRNNNADPQDSKHLSVYMSTHYTRDANRCAIGMGVGATGDSQLLSTTSTRLPRLNYASSPGISDATALSGLEGANRSNGSSIDYLYNGVSTNYSSNSTTPTAGNILIFCRGSAGSPFTLANARISFYSIGESLNLALLDARVTDLINAFAAAIP
jgi:hypothetical protein